MHLPTGWLFLIHFAAPATVRNSYSPPISISRVFRASRASSCDGLNDNRGTNENNVWQCRRSRCSDKRARLGYLAQHVNP